MADGDGKPGGAPRARPWDRGRDSRDQSPGVWDRLDELSRRADEARERCDEVYRAAAEKDARAHQRIDELQRNLNAEAKEAVNRLQALERQAYRDADLRERIERFITRSEQQAEAAARAADERWATALKNAEERATHSLRHMDDRLTALEKGVQSDRTANIREQTKSDMLRGTLWLAFATGVGAVSFLLQWAWGRLWGQP